MEASRDCADDRTATLTRGCRIPYPSVTMRRLRIDDRLIQRMRNGAGQPRCRAVRKLRVGIEGENVADRAQHFDAPGLDRECIEFSGQQFVQVEQLAALAFPAHPHSLAHVEDAMAMQEEERAVAGRIVARIQIVDEPHRQVHERVRIVLARLAHRVGRSVSSAKCRLGSRLARKRTSRSFTSSRTCFSFSSSVGTATSVVQSAGMPLLKSSLGSGSGSKERGDRVVDQVDGVLRGRDQNSRRTAISRPVEPRNYAARWETARRR